MTEYCESTDVQNRLTAIGYKFVADRDQDGTVSSAELASYITSAIDWAGSVLDDALADQIEPADARSQGSTILKHLCVDLACYRATGHGGRKPPESIEDAYDDAMERVDRISEGRKVADLTYPRTRGGHESRMPRALNPFGKKRRV